MSKINPANVKKTIYFLKRNGLKNTLGAVLERLQEKTVYHAVKLSDEELEKQRQDAKDRGLTVSFSIVVPAYKTPEKYLRELLESVLNQTYENWELILADASENVDVEQIVKQYPDDRIHYLKLRQNAGISENTNQGILLAQKEYVGLLDHDDVLTENALYEMALAIQQRQESGVIPQLLYSDEDKCDQNRENFYEPHYKEDFNLDLLLTNNYICHFMVMKRELIQQLMLRKEYDGAQDYDLVLRAVQSLGEMEKQVVHVDKILYHWRCHQNSTAENPESKTYAYEAGRRALEDFFLSRGIQVRVVHTKHLGFYRTGYTDVFAQRRDILCIGGPLYEHNRIVGGRLDADGCVRYDGLKSYQSGYMRRAAMQQDAYALDLRNICVDSRAHADFQRILGIPYREEPDTGRFDASGLDDRECIRLSLCWGRYVTDERHSRLLYDPLMGRKKR